MFRILIFLLFLIPVSGFAAHASSSDTINQRVNHKRDGYWEKKRLNGTVKFQGYYVKGEKTGYWKYYSRNGKTYREGRLVNGKREGWWYLTNASDGTRLDGTNWVHGHCVGHATMSW